MSEVLPEPIANCITSINVLIVPETIIDVKLFMPISPRSIPQGKNNNVFRQASMTSARFVISNNVKLIALPPPEGVPNVDVINTIPHIKERSKIIILLFFIIFKPKKTNNQLNQI